MKEIDQTPYEEKDIHNTATFEMAYTLQRDAEATLASQPEGRLVFTRDNPDMRIIVDSFVAKVWRGAANGSANELIEVGLGDIVKDIKESYEE